MRRKTKAIEMERLCQHQGAYGPWFHVSTYRQTKNGTWKFADKNNAHYNKKEAAKVAKEYGIGYGHPNNRKEKAQ